MMLGERFLLVENPKTASTSISHALEPYAKRVMRKHSNLQHMTADMNRRYRVYVVRNPFDRMVSGYHQNTRRRTKLENVQMNFEDWVLGDPWVLETADFKRTSQQFWGHKCNELLRFEHLEEDFARLCQKLGLECTLPHENRAARLDDYRDYYTPKLREVIEDRFYWDLKTFRYSF